MNYLAYYEVIEGSWFDISHDIDKLKSTWCLTVKIFEVPFYFTREDLDKIEKPRYPKIKEMYNLVYSE